MLTSISAKGRAYGAVTGSSFDPQFDPDGIQPDGTGEQGAVTCHVDRGADIARKVARHSLIKPSSENS
jgi:hypothetical protein